LYGPYLSQNMCNVISGTMVGNPGNETLKVLQFVLRFT
jgi:hypothetical protein